MPKKLSKRKRKTKRSKEVSLLKILTKAFVNLTKQNLNHKRSHKSMSYKKPSSISLRKPSSHKRISLRKPSSHKQNILQKISNKKVSPLKIQENKIKKKMNVFNLDKKTFINQAKLLENIKKKPDDQKYKKYVLTKKEYKYFQDEAKAAEKAKEIEKRKIKPAPTTKEQT